MFKKRAVNFKIVTTWPELVNKRILKIDNLLREVQFANSSNSLLIKGIIRRQVSYLDHYGRNRKTDDCLQIEMILGEAVYEPFSELNAVLKQEYFIFQPRCPGETQAMLEQGFSLIVLKNEPSIEKQVVTIIANTIKAKKKEKAIFNFWLKLPDNCSEPKFFTGSVFFGNQNLPPIIHGEISGIISYRSSRNLLCEMEFAQTISILLDLPILNSEETLLIYGKITDFSWEKSNKAGEWLLEIKLEYNWRLIKEKVLNCLIEIKPGNTPVHKIKALLLSRRTIFEIPKTFSFPSNAHQVTEVKVTLVEHTEKPVYQGLISHILLLIELYFISDCGIETHQEYKVDCDELIPCNCQNQSVPPEKILTRIKTRYIKSSVSKEFVNIDLDLQFLINICRNELIEISEPENSHDELILAEVFVEPKTFSLWGENILRLKCRPVQIIKVKAKVKGTEYETKRGWISINCHLEVAVSYFDKEHYFREDVFFVPCHESYLWNKLDVSDRIVLQSHLDYDSYTYNGENLFYKYILSFFAELFQTKEIKVATIENKEETPIRHKTTSHADERARSSKRLYSDKYACSCKSFLPINNYLTHIPIEGEVFLGLGKLKEIGDVKFFLMEFNCHHLHESIFLEGKIKSEIEYWDDIGYLRREMGGFSFLRLLRNNLGFSLELGNIHPELREFSYFIVKDQRRQKNCIKVIIKLELNRGGRTFESSYAEPY